MEDETRSYFTPKHGVLYFLWIMTAWTLYVLFIYPHLQNITLFPYKIVGETIRIFIFAVPILVLSYKVFDKPLEELGISKNVLKGILVGSAIALVWFLFSIFITSKIQNKQIDFSNLSVAFWLTGFSISTLVEEIGFRAFLFQSLKPIGVYFAIFASAVAFVVIHYPGWIIFNMMPNAAVFISASISIFILGLVLAIVYHRTKSIWAVVIVHAFNNLAAAIMVQK